MKRLVLKDKKRNVKVRWRRRMIIRVRLKAAATGISEYQQAFVGANVWKRSQRRTVH